MDGGPCCFEDVGSTETSGELRKSLGGQTRDRNEGFGGGLRFRREAVTSVPFWGEGGVSWTELL